MLHSILIPLLIAVALALLIKLTRSKSSSSLKENPQWPEYPCRLINQTSILSRPEIPRSHYAIHNARLMALTHNTMSRGLNAIHTQALAVKPGTKDARDILLYTSIAYDFIHDHHTFEEQVYFPRIEAATGEKGLMQENLEQHHGLEVELRKLQRYALDTRPEQYDGAALRQIIESLADVLVEHLHDEIPTILDLWDKLSSDELRKIYKAMHDQAEKSSDLFKAGPFVLGCQDKTFLMDGEFIDFPELPSHAVHYLIDWVFARKHPGAWRFNPSTMYAEPRMTEFFRGSEKSLDEKSPRL